MSSSAKGRRTGRIRATVGAAVLVGGAALAGVVVPATTAHASLACHGTSIVINSGRGAEGASYATGHRHATGNHYVDSIYGSTWFWNADNNGGSDGDTWDTYYGAISC